MTLAELARRAGVWLETVQLFEQRGLLPREGEDQYPESALDVVRFIARMQAQHQLPIATIAGALGSGERRLSEVEAELCAQVEPDPSRAGPGPASRAVLLKRTGADKDLLEALVGAELLPADGPYAGQHVWALEAAKDLIDSGLSIELVLQAGRVGLEVAETEVDAMIGEVGRGRELGEALAKTDERRTAIGRLLSVSRHGASTALMASLAKASDESKQLAMESIHVPSRLFLARHGLDGLLERQRVEAQRVVDVIQVGREPVGEGEALALREHGRLLLAVGRFGEAANLLESALTHPLLACDPPTWCYLALAHAVEGQSERSLAVATRATQLGPGSARVHAFHAAVLALVASRAGDVFVATAWVQECLVALEASRSGAHVDALAELEALLTRGRLCTVMPESFGVREGGLEDLARVLAGTGPEAAESLGLLIPGALELMRINALYYTGMALWDAGDQVEAQRLLAEVVSLDPVSPFATRAFQRL